ncbi:MAG: quinolinate synthase NadA [Candidatus Bathyarchaeota archaeon]|nr:MAG: quinolinate synthase NadA [Candidatus Bathyarchaeota archaeon]
MGIIDDIHSIKREKNALLLTHNYQHPEVQDTADNVGDSIELSQRAMQEKDAEILVFAAVDFIAESAASPNPDKKVLLPTLGSRGPMVQTLLVQ